MIFFLLVLRYFAFTFSSFAWLFCVFLSNSSHCIALGPGSRYAGIAVVCLLHLAHGHRMMLRCRRVQPAMGATASCLDVYASKEELDLVPGQPRRLENASKWEGRPSSMMHRHEGSSGLAHLWNPPFRQGTQGTCVASCRQIHVCTCTCAFLRTPPNQKEKELEVSDIGEKTDSPVPFPLGCPSVSVCRRRIEGTPSIGCLIWCGNSSLVWSVTMAVSLASLLIPSRCLTCLLHTHTRPDRSA